MTIVFNFYGGPGTGKTTSAAYCFAMSKDDQYNSEYVNEAAKDRAWDKKPIRLRDQFELFEEQTKREKRPYGEAALIFADSPVWLSAYYSSLHKNSSRFGEATCVVVEELCKEFYREARSRGVQHIDIWLKRIKPYNKKGRFQTEEEAKEIDNLMRPYLESLGVQFIDCEGKKEKVYELVTSLLEKYPVAKIG